MKAALRYSILRIICRIKGHRKNYIGGMLSGSYWCARCGEYLGSHSIDRERWPAVIRLLQDADAAGISTGSLRDELRGQMTIEERAEYGL